MKNTKFNSLNELLEEIDNWINTLENKKKTILKATKGIDYSPESEQKTLLDENFPKKIKKVFTSYSVSIYRDNYDLLVKKADKADMSISSFLKKKYLLNFLNNKEIYKDYDMIKSKLGDRIAKGRNMDRKAIGLALDDNDTREFNKACLEFNKSSKDMLRFIVDLFLYDVLTEGKIAKEFDYGYENINLTACKDSKALSAYGYDYEHKYLFIKFKEGDVYLYRGVPEKVYTGLCEADSKGHYFNENIMANQKLYKCIRIRKGEK